MQIGQPQQIQRWSSLMPRTFRPGGALAVDGGDEIIPVVNALRDHFNLVV